jgi:hypothetical protein
MALSNTAPAPRFVTLHWNKEKFLINVNHIQLVHHREDGSSTVVFYDERLKLNPRMTEELEKRLAEWEAAAAAS